MKYLVIAIMLIGCGGPERIYEPRDGGQGDVSDTMDADQYSPDANETGPQDGDVRVPDGFPDSDPDSTPDTIQDGGPDSEEQDAARDSDIAEEDASLDADSDTGGDEPDPGCPDGQERCEGRCVDLSSDIGNCGSCGRSCSSGRLPTCFNGECHAYTSCSEGGNACEGRCADELGAVCSTSCTSARSILRGPLMIWPLYLEDWTEVGWDRCDDILHFPPFVWDGCDRGRSEYPGGDITACCCNLG